MYRTGSVRHQAVTKGQVLELQDYKICRYRGISTKVLNEGCHLNEERHNGWDWIGLAK